MKRIVAANRVVAAEGEMAAPGAVEIDGCRVALVTRLDGEQAFTEWLGGTITLRRLADGSVGAFKEGRQLTAREGDRIWRTVGKK